MEHIRIRAFRAVDDRASCIRYVYEHSRLLEEIGVSSALLHDDRWCTDERTVMVLAEHETLGIVGGLRLQHAAPERRLPVHVALGSRDTGIEKLVENARPGMAELCGLWNARRFAGRGVPWIMTSAAVAAAPRAGVHQLLCLAADYTMKYPLMNGFRVLSQVGEKGAFSYPIPGYTSYLLCHPDTSAMVAGDSTHFRRLNDLRRNTGITRLEVTNKVPLLVTYDLDMNGTASMSSLPHTELRRSA
ncbi:MAG: hypothetical protein IPN85_13615 [Flavobacteriales bacterium]|nr:hypothetical protein [Flavobacteriales bacterium]MBL0035897.1 hypothetical protein [Flavobacteriales bacterium]